jgi:two-component system sensor histidine kinase KdpD
MRLARRLLAARGAGILAGLAGTALVAYGIELASGQVNVLSMSVCFQLLVLLVSGAFGVWAGLVTSVASAITVNFMFVPPVHTLTIGDARNWVSLAVFAATAIVTAHFAAGFRRQRRESEERRRDAELLERMAATVLGEIGAGPPGPHVAAAAAVVLGVTSCALVLDPGAGAGRAESLTPSAEGFAVPLVAGGRPIGLLEVGPALPDEEPRWGSPGLAEAVAGLVAVAVERGRLIQSALEAEGLRRSDELKTALLHGVSHEFRTPLTSIRTAAEGLVGAGPRDTAALVTVMTEEVGRLDRLVANLLDLSRLETGALTTRLDWCAADEMAAGALAAAAPLLGAAEVRLDVPADLPLVRADPVLCERILVNLLHNAVRHGRPPVRLEGRATRDRLELAVSDGGPGVDPALGERAFRPFTVAGPSGGTGVGLALSRGLAEAQGATLALAPAGGGARFVLALPLAPVPQVA